MLLAAGLKSNQDAKAGSNLNVGNPNSGYYVQNGQLVSRNVDIRAKGIEVKQNGEVYVGEFNSQKQKHGRGVMKSERFGEYEGDWRWDKAHGIGKWSKPDGSVCIGEFQEGILHGQGKQVTAKGNIYVGSFRLGEYDGEGLLIFTDGRMYIGEFSDGNNHGKGAFFWPSGNKYYGDFVNGKIVSKQSSLENYAWQNES